MMSSDLRSVISTKLFTRDIQEQPKDCEVGIKRKYDTLYEKKCKPVQKSLQRTIYEDKCMNVNQNCVTMFDNKFEIQKQGQ